MRLSRDIWSKVLRRLDDTTSLMPTLEILTDYVVCNSSLEPIRFGQVNIFVSFHIFKGLLLLYYCSVDTDLSTVLVAIVGYLYLNPYQGIIMWLHKSSFRKIDDSWSRLISRLTRKRTFYWGPVSARCTHGEARKLGSSFGSALMEGSGNGVIHSTLWRESEASGLSFTNALSNPPIALEIAATFLCDLSAIWSSNTKTQTVPYLLNGISVCKRIIYFRRILLRRINCR